jgi:hypothetical protein
VYFNNHPLGKAVRNAQTLEKILKKLGLLTAGGKDVKNEGTGSMPS